MIMSSTVSASALVRNFPQMRDRVTAGEIVEAASYGRPVAGAPVGWTYGLVPPGSFEKMHERMRRLRAAPSTVD